MKPPKTWLGVFAFFLGAWILGMVAFFIIQAVWIL